jgi:hypothetical protein
MHLFGPGRLDYTDSLDIVKFTTSGAKAFFLPKGFSA